MQLDFWQYSEGTVERIVALIAGRVREAGDRLLVVDSDPERRRSTSQALWETSPPAFLANGEAGDQHAARQPIVFSPDCLTPNGASVAVIADGEWREAGEGFARAILLFGADRVEGVRAVWRRYDGREDVTRSYYEQDAGKWVKRA